MDITLKTEVVHVDDDIDEYFAHLPGVIGEVYDQALSGMQRAEAILDLHKPGVDKIDGPSYVDVSNGSVDAFVNLNDDQAAASIDDLTGALKAAFG